jgi:hypothetical protein
VVAIGRQSKRVLAPLQKLISACSQVGHASPGGRPYRPHHGRFDLI